MSASKLGAGEEGDTNFFGSPALWAAASLIIRRWIQRTENFESRRAASHLYLWIPPPREPGSSATISPRDPPEFPLTTFSATCLWPQNPVFRPTVCSNSYQPGGPGPLTIFPALLEVPKSCQKCHLEKCLKFKLLQKAEGTCRWTSDQLLQHLPRLQSLCCSRSMPPQQTPLLEECVISVLASLFVYQFTFCFSGGLW